MRDSPAYGAWNVSRVAAGTGEALPGPVLSSLACATKITSASGRPDGRHRPAGPRQEQVGHVPGARGQIRRALLLESPDAAAPAVRRPVGAFGEITSAPSWPQAVGQPFDLLGEDALAGLAVLDEHVGQPVPHHVQAGVELRRCLHHQLPPPMVDGQQLVDEHERVPRPCVSAEHDDRPGQPRGQLLGGEFRFLDLDLQPVRPRRTGTSARPRGGGSTWVGAWLRNDGTARRQPLTKVQLQRERRRRLCQGRHAHSGRPVLMRDTKDRRTAVLRFAPHRPAHVRRPSKGGHFEIANSPTGSAASPWAPYSSYGEADADEAGAVFADAAVLSGVDAGGAEEAGADVGGDDDVGAIGDVLGEADADVVGVGFRAEDVGEAGVGDGEADER